MPGRLMGLFKRIVLCALCWLAVTTAAVHAQSFEQAVARFAADSFGDTEAAIAEVAASGHARAAAVIQALRDGRLVADATTKKVYVKDQGGSVTDAITGAAVADPPASLKTVRLNNRVRRAIEAALGSLTLLAADPQKRYEAAQAVFKSRDASALPTLDAALAKETDAREKQALREAHAGVVLLQPDAA